MNDGNILAQTGLGTVATKVLVDLITIGWPTRPTWVAPTASLVSGILCIGLQQLATGAALSVQLGADSILNGIVAGGLAMGITALGNTAQSKRQEAGS